MTESAFQGGQAKALWILPAMLALSLASGYRALPVDPAFAWIFSPVGLVSSIWMTMPFSLESIRSASSFSPGSFGWTPDYFRVFALTCLLEAPFCWIALRRFGAKRAFERLLVLNALTHPAVFFLFPALFKNYLGATLASESFAHGLEAWLAYRWIGAAGLGASHARWAAFWVVVANLVSWQLGGLL